MRKRKNYKMSKEALRNRQGVQTLEKIWTRSRMPESEALQLAYRELHQERRKKSRSQ